MYHEVLPDSVALPAWTVVRESDFRWQMHFVQEHFDVLSLDDALERVYRPIESNKPLAVITFDDGYRGNIEIVLPIMRSMGMPFTLYVATQAITSGKLFWYDEIIGFLSHPNDLCLSVELEGRLEKFMIHSHASGERRWEIIQQLLMRLKGMPPLDRSRAVEAIVEKWGARESPLQMLTAENLRELAKSDCVTVGSHTHAHELLNQLEPKQIRQTLIMANEVIAHIIGRLPRHFAYPNGNFNVSAINEVRGLSFKSAVTTGPGVWSSFNDRLLIPRIAVGRFENRNSFRARLSGLI